MKNQHLSPAQDFIDQAIDLEKQGAFQQAEKAYLQGIAKHPDDYVLFSRLGALLVNLDRAKEAVLRFQQARRLNPDDPAVLFNSGLAHQVDNDFEAAIGFFTAAMEKGYDKGMVYGSLAEIYEQTNRLDELKALLDKALKEAPEDVFLLFNAAKMERRRGNLEAALAHLQAAEKLGDFSEIAMMTHFERGRIYDKLGQAAKAYQAFQQGNLVSVRENMRPGLSKQNFLDLIKAYGGLDFAGVLKGTTLLPDERRRTPAFIVGFPRSGTTLLHQILDGHPGLEVLEEKPYINQGRANLVQSHGSLARAFSSLRAEDWSTMARELLALYGSQRTKPGARIIDKLPLHIIEIPLILKLFPGAKFLVVLRHPFDCTLSCFMQNFGLNNAMLNFTNLDDATHLYREVFSLWERYRRELKPDFMYVRYEDVVDDLEKEARKILAFLGLDWHPGVLEYREKALARTRIHTPSYHQVIQPIYQDSKNRWRAYEKFFRPYAKRLVPFCEAFGYDH